MERTSTERRIKLDGIDPALFEEFILEARETLDQAEADLLLLESEGEIGDPEIVNRLFRALHSIKGGSGFFDLAQIGALSHGMENVLSKVRDGKINLDSELISYMFFSLDLLKRMVDDPRADNSEDIEKPLQVLDGFAEKTPGPVTGGKSDSVSAYFETAEDPGDAAPGGSVESTSESGPSDATAGRSLFSSIEPEKIEELARFGMNLYHLEISLADHIEQRGLTLDGFISGISDLGEVMAVEPALGDFGGLETCAGNDLRIDLVVASVLDADLAPAGFDIHPTCIEKISLNAPESSCLDQEPSLQAVDDDATASPGKKSAPARETTEPAVSPPGRKKTANTGGAPKKSCEKSLSSEQSPSSTMQRPEDTVRVKTRILNSLMEMAGELVLGRNRLFHLIENDADETDGLDSAKTRLTAITTSLQQEIIKTRLQPIFSLFGRYPRMVRDLSRKLGKEVTLFSEGMDVDLDRAILENLADPLTHLVRNAMDHGIEPPDEREIAGKPRCGSISMTACNEHGVVVIEVEDDGRGIELEWIITRALSRRIVTEEMIDNLSEEQILDLVLLPGFSTVEEVTSVSGRGVGLDIVKTNIERIGGDVELKSTPGKGTTVSLKLPLTLAILPALIVSAGNRRFAVPQVSVEEVLRLSAEENTKKVGQVQGMQVLRHRDTLLPLLKLADILKLDQPDAEERTPDGSVRRLLVLKAGRHRFGMLVDRILDNEEIVVKPLSRYLRSLPYYSGGSILGDDDIVLILDPVGIAHATGIDQADLAQASEKTGGRAPTVDTAGDLFLFDPGGGEILALPFFQVSRIERFPDGGLERLGSMDYMNVNSDSIPLLDIRSILGLSRGDEGITAPNMALLPRSRSRKFAIPIARIIDSSGLVSEPEMESFKHDGVLGTCLSGERLVLLLDLDGLSRVAGFSPAPAPTEPPPDRRVLLVDASGLLMTLQRIQLEKAGITVSPAAEMEKGWRLLQEQMFDAILVDSSIIETNGCILLERVRKDTRLSGIPLITLYSSAVRESGILHRDSAFDATASKLDGAGILSALEAVAGIETGSIA